MYAGETEVKSQRNVYLHKTPTNPYETPMKHPQTSPKLQYVSDVAFA